MLVIKSGQNREVILTPVFPLQTAVDCRVLRCMTVARVVGMIQPSALWIVGDLKQDSRGGRPNYVMSTSTGVDWIWRMMDLSASS